MQTGSGERVHDLVSMRPIACFNGQFEQSPLQRDARLIPMMRNVDDVAACISDDVCDGAKDAGAIGDILGQAAQATGGGGR